MSNRPGHFSPQLITLLRVHLPQAQPVLTLTNKRPNWVVAMDDDGLLVETQRSRAAGSGPQLVPAWMLEAGWERLTMRGMLTNRELLATDDLNVKRSSFVCAALACLPNVGVTSLRPLTLTYEP